MVAAVPRARRDFVTIVLSMNRTYFIPLLAALLLPSASSAGPAIGFEGLTCKADIRSALLGRRMPNGAIASIEAKHKDIGVKNLGAYGMESDGDPWTLIFWQICGREYLVLERKGVVRDVLESPLAPGSPQGTIVSCTVAGAELKDTVIAFETASNPKWPKAVKNAWRINDATVTFSKFDGDKTVCAP